MLSRISLAALLLLTAACDRGATPATDKGNGTAEAAGDAARGSMANAVAETDANATAPEPAPPEIVLSEGQVRAQYTPALDACLNSGDAAKGVSVAMGGCFHAELKQQDDRLNAAYRAALAKRDPAGQARFRAEERPWNKARDAECRAVAVGGTINLVEVPACLLDATIRRRVTLQPMAG